MFHRLPRLLRSFSHRSTSNHLEVTVTPNWFVAWGHLDQLGDNITWRDEQFAIAHAQPTFSPQERQELWLVRDRTGCRTLYYTTQGATRWIAPRLRTVAPYRSNELDLVALRDYLCCAFVPEEQTLWQDVRELRPGTRLRLPDATMQVYWEPIEDIRHTEPPLEWHGQQLRSLLETLISRLLTPW